MKKNNKQTNNCKPEDKEVKCCYERLRKTFNFGTVFTVCLFFSVLFVGVGSTFIKVSSVLRHLEGQPFNNIGNPSSRKKVIPSQNIVLCEKRDTSADYCTYETKDKCIGAHECYTLSDIIALAIFLGLAIISVLAVIYVCVFK